MGACASVSGEELTTATSVLDDEEDGRQSEILCMGGVVGMKMEEVVEGMLGESVWITVARVNFPVCLHEVCTSLGNNFGLGCRGSKQRQSDESPATRLKAWARLPSEARTQDASDSDGLGNEPK